MSGKAIDPNAAFRIWREGATVRQRRVRSRLAAILLIMTAVCVASALGPRSAISSPCDSLAAKRSDLVFFFPDSLTGQVQRWADYRYSHNGYSSLLVPVEDLPSCGFGTDRKQAIRNFIVQLET